MEWFTKVSADANNAEAFLKAINSDCSVQEKNLCAGFFLVQSPPDIQVENFTKFGAKVLDYVQWIFQQPYEKDIDDYENNGLQSLGYNICQYMSISSMANPKLGKLMAVPAYAILEKFASSDVSVTGGPKSAQAMRGKALACLISTVPIPRGMDWDPTFIPNFIKILNLYEKVDNKDIKTQVGTLNTYVSTYCPQLLRNQADTSSILERALGGDMSSWQTMASEKIIQDNKETIFKRFDEILAINFITTQQFLLALAGCYPRELGAYMPQFTSIVEKGMQHNMESMMIMIVGKIAMHNPELVHPSVDKLLPPLFKKPMCRVMIPSNILQPCASQDPPYYFMKMIELLPLPNLDPNTIPSAMYGLQNIVLSDGVERPVVERSFEVIQKYESQAEAVVEKIKDWLAGRSLETIEKRVDGLEERINEMNDAVQKSCANFDDVKKYIDENIADVKEFVAEVAKKLPKPSKLTIITGKVQNTLRLHFVCAKTQYEWTCETNVWKKWLKMGITLGKVGATALSVAGGNIGGLAKGPKLLKNAYNLYKSSDDDDFNNWCTQPFLTSTEQDKLVEQLRESGYFDVFVYEAQLGDWVCLEGVQGKEKADYESKLMEEQRRKDPAVVKTSSRKKADLELEMANKKALQDYQDGVSDQKELKANAPSNVIVPASDMSSNTSHISDIAKCLERIDQLEARIKLLEETPASGKNCCIIS